MRISAGRQRHPLRSRYAGMHGFTLLEIMVAIVVLSIIMTTAYGALRMGARSWEAGVERTLESDDLRSTASFLQRQISQALVMTWPDELERHITFSGERTRLQFIAPAPLQSGDAGLYEYTLSVEDGATGSQLVLAYIPYDPGGEAFRKPGPDQRLVLAQRLDGVEFDYFGNNARLGAVSSNAVPAWHSQWDQAAQQAPALVRIRIAADTAAGRWPELVIPLQAQIDDAGT